MGPVPNVPHLRSSYAALRLPNVHRPKLRFPSLSAYQVAGVFFLVGLCMHPLTQDRRRFGYGSPLAVSSLGDVRASQVTGPSSSYVPKTSTPPEPSTTNPPHRFGFVFSPGEGLDVRDWRFRG